MEQTQTLIKPDAYNKSFAGSIIADVLNVGFTIRGIKLIQLTEADARKFYEIHSTRDFYGDLVLFMSSAPVITIALTKDNAVKDFRELLGSADPSVAEVGTLREKYGESIRYNALHGSDSVENGLKEISFFFSEIELI